MALTVELVTLHTADQVPLPAGWVPADSPPTVPLDAAVVHGGASAAIHYPLNEVMTRAFLGAGLPVLVLATRGHDELWLAGRDRRMGHAVETIHECLLDFRAALDWWDARGARRVALVGHSMGATKTLYYAAHGDDPRLAAAVALSTPRLSARFFAEHREARTAFAADLERARSLAAAGRGEEIVTWQFPFRGNLLTPVAYLDHYSDERYNAASFIDRITVPTLLVEGEREGHLVHRGFAQELAALARPGRAHAVIVPGADHMYAGCTAELAASIGTWLTTLAAAS